MPGKVRKLPQGIPTVRAMRKSPRNTRNHSRKSSCSPSMTFLAGGPRRRRNILPKAAFSTRFTRTDLAEGNRGYCERGGGTTQYIAGLRSHHGTDADMALEHHPDPACRPVPEGIRTDPRPILGHPRNTAPP